ASERLRLVRSVDKSEPKDSCTSSRAAGGVSPGATGRRGACGAGIPAAGGDAGGISPKRAPADRGGGGGLLGLPLRGGEYGAADRAGGGREPRTAPGLRVRSGEAS